MKELQQVVNESIQAMIDDGTVEKIIKDKLHDTIKSAIDSAMRSYSDFGKALEKHIETSLSVDFSNVNLDEYNHTIKGLIEGIVNKHYIAEARDKLAKQLEELFEPAPAEISLDDLIARFKKENDDDAAGDHIERIGLIITSERDGHITVGLSKEPPKERSSYLSSTRSEHPELAYEHRLYIRDGELRWCHLEGDRGNSFMPTTLYGFARVLFQMYCQGTRITVRSTDADDYDTTYSWYE